jgi:hypothetical protein
MTSRCRGQWDAQESVVMHAETDQLPIESDFIDSQSRDLDERHAVKMFLGKTRARAEEMFRQNFLFYQEDLTYMRPAAFRFYLIPAMQYLLSDAAAGDSDAASTFCHMLEHRLRTEPETLKQMKDVVLDAIRRILDSFARYACSPEIYGDVPARYRELACRLNG